MTRPAAPARTPYPDPEECRRTLRALGAPPAIVEHTDAVAAAAEAIARAISARGVTVDVELVRAGAHLHDAGRARTHGLDHAAVGADLLRERGLPEAVCRIAETHTGAGIEPQDARALGLPSRDYEPRTVEERIVCQADNLVDGTRRQKVQEELAHLRGRGLAHVADKMERLHRELSTLAGRDLDEIR